jgi:hypothetical protein
VTTDSLPDRATIDATVKIITDTAPAMFLWNYDRDRDQLVTLYNRAMAFQWDSTKDLDWSTDVDPEKVIRELSQPNLMVELARKAKDVNNSPFKNWSEKQFLQLGVESLTANLSQFMHGEQGAMLAAAKIVETVPWIDAKYYAATQTMDEARHTEVFAKYLHEKLGEPYSMTPFLEDQVTDLIADSRWDFTYLGMQIVIESLALAAFGGLLQQIQEPLLRKLLRYVLSDEARHVAFGIISLKEYYEGLTDAELMDRQEFLAENTLRNRARSANGEMWVRLGVDPQQAMTAMMEAALTSGISPFATFERGFFSKLVPNVRKLGLLDANDGYLRKLWADAGLLQYEFAEDTASDYEAYNAVAADRGEL